MHIKTASVMPYVFGILALTIVSFTIEIGAQKVPDVGEAGPTDHIKIERPIDN